MARGAMRLGLAVVAGRADDSCRVVPLGGSDPLHAAFAEPFRPHASSLGDGCLVALDLAVVPPAVVYRWFPATVLVATADKLTLDEPFHGTIEAHVRPGVPLRPHVGQTVYVSLGLTETWRIDAPEDDPAAAVGVLPELKALYARMT